MTESDPPDPPEPRRLRKRPAHHPRWLLRWSLIVLGLILVTGVPALIAGVVAYRDLKRAQVNLLDARRDLTALRPDAAGADLRRANPELAQATSWLTSVATLPARLIPGIRGNVEMTIDLARSGSQISAAGGQSVLVLDELGVQTGKSLSLFNNGTVNLQLLEGAAPAALAVQQRLNAADLLARSHYSFLIPQLRHARQTALSDLVVARGEANAAQAATAVLPGALGAYGPKTWLVEAGNTAEERGRAGYLGDFAVVEVNQGHISVNGFVGTGTLPTLITASGPDVPAEYQSHYVSLGALESWPNLTMSPSFPDGSELLLSRLQASGGPVADGIVEMDPTALSYLMEVTGPVTVPGIPVELTSANVVPWALNLIYGYDAASSAVRKATLSDIAQAVSQKLLSGGADPIQLAKAFSRAIKYGHLFVYSSQSSEETSFSSLGISGSIAQGPGDYLLVLNQNFGENKMDYYMQRTINYDATVSADGSEQVRLTVALHNTAPPGVTLTADVGGARPQLGLAASTDRAYLEAEVPAGAVLAGVTLGGVPVTGNNLDNGLELGKRYFGIVADVGPGVTTSAVFTYRVPDALVAGHYQLTVQNQATVRPDQLSVHVDVPKGLTVAGTRAVQADGDLDFTGTPLADLQLGAPTPNSGE